MANRRRLAGIFADLDPIDAKKLEELDGTAVVRISSVEAMAVHEELRYLRYLRLKDPARFDRLLNATRRGRGIVPSAFPVGWLDVSKDDSARGLRPGIGVLLAGMSTEEAFLTGFLVGRRAGADAMRQLAKELSASPGAIGGREKGKRGVRRAIEHTADILNTRSLNKVLQALCDEVGEDLYCDRDNPTDVHAFKVESGRLIFTRRNGEEDRISLKTVRNYLSAMPKLKRKRVGNPPIRESNE